MKLGLMIASLFFFTQSSRASIQVVESIPLETNLAVPGVQDTQSAWLELINAAHHTIDIEEFYISSGASLVPVLNALKAAAGRGVKIRILIDSQFYKTYPNDPNDLAKSSANIELKTIDFSANGGIMHAKYFVIDAEKAYAGSANMDWLALYHIHEIGLKIDDTGLASGLESIFNWDWSKGAASSEIISPQIHGGGHVPAPSPRGPAPALQLFASPTNDLPAGISATLPSLLSLIANAKNSLKIQMYEYSTSVYGSSAKFKDLDNALRAAAARGVKVQMVVDHTALNAGRADLQALSRLANVDLKIITIPQWSGGPLQYARLAHSKYLIADDQAMWIGSENWSGDYFNSSRNVGVITTDTAQVATLVQVFTAVRASSYLTSP